VRRADHSSREVLPSMACLECDSEALKMRRPRPTVGLLNQGKIVCARFNVI